MHQHPRPPPQMASPASSPRTNPTRTNNPREEGQAASHSRAPSETPAYNEGDESGAVASEGMSPVSGPSRDAVKKLDQIIQNFHTKAAIVILQSRVSLPVIISRDGSRKVNKWFQLETDDTDAYRDDLRLWKTCGGFDNRPPSLILETYLDTSGLTRSQTLVIIDDQGKRWDVQEALNTSNESNDGNTQHRKSRTEVVLERWTIELKDGSQDQNYDFGAILPTVYKKSIVFFRSLYATTKFVPTWRFVKALGKSGTSSGLRVRCRITTGENFRTPKQDPLTHPLYKNDAPVTDTFSLGETDSPAGRFFGEVCYRRECNFRVDDSEALLSSRFMGADEYYFQPSLGITRDQPRPPTKTIEVGSLPAHRQRLEQAEPTQAYGSMSTFHGDAPPLGSSPISALRAARYVGSENSSPPTSPIQKARPIQTSRALESLNVARRPSLSFQPFKAGSLSASPGPSNPLIQTGEMLPPGSPHSLSRASGISALAQARNRSSLTSGMPSTLRGVPIVPENAIASSTSSSPKPAPITRFSSSFSHRRNKPSFGGASKVDDDQGSSGKQSLSSSSAQPGSGILADGGAGGSSGSLQTDDEAISDFLKLLDSKKTLQSFEPSHQGEASTKRTSAQLSRFQSMRESHNALTESMSSSMLMHRSSSSSSRQLASVPPMVAGTSMSISSSPGKPVSPHTPHTPAIPSRLSSGSTAEYPPPRRFRDRSRTEPQPRIDDVSGDENASNELGTNAIDIPTSPRPYYPNRRSSSVAQQHRSVAVDDDAADLAFGVHRSISLGAEEREAPSLSALLGQGHATDVPINANQTECTLQPAAHIEESSEAINRHSSISPDQEGTRPPRGFLLPASMNALHRPIVGHVGGRGVIPPQAGSFASLADRGSTSSTMAAGTRYSFTRPAGLYDPDDELLLFDMSEIAGSGRDAGRRSIEDARSSGGTSTTERGGFERRGGESGSSSQRGSRRW